MPEKMPYSGPARRIECTEGETRMPASSEAVGACSDVPFLRWYLTLHEGDKTFSPTLLGRFAYAGAKFLIFLDFSTTSALDRVLVAM
jgi:hypothetical protein